jgi:hypothetical protein
LCYAGTNGIGLVVGEKKGEAMKKHWLRGILLALCVSLPLVGAALAQDVQPDGPLQTPPDPPSAVEGVYVTTEDNENNAGTGVADGDMGGSGSWGVCPEDQNAPVEFNIVLGEEICSGGLLSLAGDDFESGLHEVYVNGRFLGFIPPQAQGQWQVFLFEVPQAALDKGENLVQVVLVDDCGYVVWGALAIEPCEEEEFVPEPGTILLLGSGLAGPAGYATLRWRSRQ